MQEVDALQASGADGGKASGAAVAKAAGRVKHAVRMRTASLEVIFKTAVILAQQGGLWYPM